MKNKFQVSSFKFQVRKGFTLIEMLIYIGLLSIFLIILTEIFTSIINIQLESEAANSIEQDARYITSRLSYEINRATSINTPAPGSTTQNLTLTIGSETFTYNTTGTDLIMTNNSGPVTVNSSESQVSNIQFQRLGNLLGKNTVKITFTLTGTTQKSQGPESRNFQTTVGIR